jgi:hypothetical protein
LVVVVLVVLLFTLRVVLVAVVRVDIRLELVQLVLLKLFQ